MIGASKLTDKDVRQIKRLLKDGDMTCQAIANMFKVSRVHISHIKHGRKWNKTNHSFLMKQDIRGYTRTITLINGVEYSTGISPIYTLNGERYVLTHYINKSEYRIDGLIYDVIPPYEELREKHNSFVKRFVDK